MQKRSSMIRTLVIALPLSAIPLLVGGALPPGMDEARVELSEHGLVLELPPLEEREERRFEEGQEQVRWSGKLGEHELQISFLYLEGKFAEPGDVTELAVDTYREVTPGFAVEEQRFFEGDYGFASFASLIVAGLREPDRTDAVGTQYVLAGLLPEGAWALQVECRPRPGQEQEKQILDFFEKGVTYQGEVRDPSWSKEEVLERWLRDAPDELHEDFVKGMRKRSTAKKIVIRTRNYLIMTNSFSGKKFAEQMEENYETIVEVFPFADVKGRKLMPVFLFRTADQYFDFYVKVAGTTKEKARRSKGHAWRDYYATWYEAPTDPVHIHECTHQIFKNRLRLNGGGSWFQEGVAEYIETSENDRNVVASLVEKGRHTPLREFFALPSLLYSSEEDRASGGSAAGDNYKQAALLIEFLRESKFGKKRFEDFLYAMGQVPRNDVEKIAEVLHQVYAVTIEELEVEFQKYCKKR
jgi:hypothetical protein